jgi:hypothetical protein
VILTLIFLSKMLFQSKTSLSPLDSKAAAPNAFSAFPAGGKALPIRLLAGYKGVQQVDSAGQTWEEDRYFHGGSGLARPDSPVARTSDAMLFRQWRTGDFGYDIPLAPGAYELHLYFVASNRENEEFATFQLRMNGQTVLNDFDIVNDAEGENIADERVFRDVSPASDGKLHLEFASERGVPVISAIKIVPGVAHKQLPIRILTQNSAFVDHVGNQWQRDNFFFSGKMKLLLHDVEQTPDPGLYAGERYGHFSYAAPVDPRDRYTLVLHFVESYFGPNAPGGGGVGNRVFRVLCNGSTLLDDFDIYKEAGSFHGLSKTFHHLKPTAQGKLNIIFEPVTNYATVSAMEVLDEGS